MVKCVLAVVPLIGTTIGAIIGTSRGLSYKFEQQEDIIVDVATGILCSITYSLCCEAVGNIRNIGLLIGVLAGYIFSTVMNQIAHQKKLNTRSKLFWAMLIHNIPEGIIIGISLMDKSVIPTIIPLILSITLQNVPDGLVVAMPLVSTKGRKNAALYGVFSGVIEPVLAILLIIVAGRFENILKYESFFIGFAFLAIIIIAIELLKESKNKRTVFISAITTTIFCSILG